jgi:hypothetical protein
MMSATDMECALELICNVACGAKMACRPVRSFVLDTLRADGLISSIKQGGDEWRRKRA